MNLVKKLALTLAVTTTVTTSAMLATGCDDYISKNQKSMLTANLSAEISAPITEIIYIMPEFSSSEHYVSFIGHYDESDGMKPYENHKDYRVTYKISKEEYYQLITLCKGNTFREISMLLESEFDFVNSIINNYAPIEVKEYELSKYHTITEEDRFNADEFNKQ